MTESISSFLRMVDARTNFIEHLKGDFEQGIKKGNLPLVKEILEKGMSVNWPLNQDGLPLHLAIRENQPEIVSLLLEHGANPEMADTQKLTAIDHAVLMNNQEILGRLLSHKLGKDLKEIQEQLAAHDRSFFFGSSYLSETQAKTQRLSVITNADMEKMGKISRNSFFGVLAQMRNLGPLRILNHKDANGFTPIHYAILGNQTASFERLVTAGVDCKVLSADGNSLLHFAALKGSKKIVDRLIQLGHDPNGQNANGDTPLHFAALQGHLAVAEALVKAGAKINVLNRYKVSPLALIGTSSSDKDPLKLNRMQLILFAAASVDWLCQLATASGWISNPAQAWAAKLSLNVQQIANLVQMNYLPINDMAFRMGLLPLSENITWIQIPIRAITIYCLCNSIFQSAKVGMKNLYRKHDAAKHLFVHAVTAAHSLHSLAQKCYRAFYPEKSLPKTENPVCTALTEEKLEQLKNASILDRVLDPDLNPKCFNHAIAIIDPTKLKELETTLYSTWRHLGLHTDKNPDPRAQTAFIKSTEAINTIKA